MLVSLILACKFNPCATTQSGFANTPRGRRFLLDFLEMVRVLPVKLAQTRVRTYRTVLISPCHANFFDPLAVCREQSKYSSYKGLAKLAL
jgi:hypothetical protein